MQYEIRYTLIKVFYVQVWFKCENSLHRKLFTEKNRFFSVGYINEMMGVIISIKKVNKNLNILKKWYF